MYLSELSYEDHAAIYSAALLFVFRVAGKGVPSLAKEVSELVYRRLLLYCAGLCLLHKHQTCLGIARQLGGCSHDALTRVLHSAQWTACQLMASCLQVAIHLASAGDASSCWLILDDVILPKGASKQILAAYWDHDYVHQKNIRCVRVVVLCWTNGLVKIPIFFLLWHKKGSLYLKEHHQRYRTKNELARILVYLALRKGVPFQYLLFDSWYAGTAHLKWYARRGIRFVTATKNTRKVRLLSVPLAMRPPRPRKNTKVWVEKSPSQLAQEYPHTRAYHYYPAIHCRTRRWEITIKGYPDFLSLVCIKNYATNRAFKKMVTPADKKQKDPNKYLLTNACDLTVAEIVGWYRRRWDIEVLFRDCKQHLGFHACQARSVQAQERHIACVFLSYVLLEQMKADAAPSQKEANTWTIGKVKEWLNRQYLLPGTLGAWKPSFTPTELETFSEEQVIALLSQEHLLPETANLRKQDTQRPQNKQLKKCA
jgi:SRSO17 transposase